MASSIPKPRTASFATHSPMTINIPLDSRVVLSKRRSGWVRYIGKLKNEAGEWYGISLDEGKGENDGTWEKERHFDCAANHGVFVRRKEIFCVKEYPSRSKGSVSPVMPDNSDAGSSTDSSADSQDAPLAPAPAAPQHTSVTRPLLRTFKSFRKELELQVTPVKANNNNSSSSSATNSPKSSTPTAAASAKSSGLRSPSNSRFVSFSAVSGAASRTASIVSSMVVSLADKPKEAEQQQPKPQIEVALLEQQPNQEQKQQQSPTERSVSDLMGGGGDICSLSDLYNSSGSANNDAISIPEASTTPSPPPPPPPTASARTRTIAVTPARVPSPPSPTRTAVESMRSCKVASEPVPTPLFFRMANVGSSTIGRRASFSCATSGSAGVPGSSCSGSGGMAGATSPTHAQVRIDELEKEINVMKTNHENIVAVLRATNKQHAANVLELRAQVEALTEGNNWLEKQLASKNALVAELRRMEKSDDRIPRAEVENIIAIKDAQIQTLEKEILKLKQQVLRIETEKDSILCQQVRHFHARQERDEARIHKLREDVLSMCNERTNLQSELQDLKEMSFLF